MVSVGHGCHKHEIQGNVSSLKYICLLLAAEVKYYNTTVVPDVSVCEFMVKVLKMDGG